MSASMSLKTQLSFALDNKWEQLDPEAVHVAIYGTQVEER